MALTPKQARFVQEYLVDLNATAAAKRAGYSERTAYSIGQRLLKNVEIQKALQTARAALQERTGITMYYVLTKLKEVADADASDAQDSDLRFSNKLRALELLGKHLGVFDRGGPAGDPDVLNSFLRAVRPTREEVEALYAEAGD